MTKLPSVKNLEVSGKKVLLRTDYDVPLVAGKVADGSRIDESLPTIDFLLGKDARVVILSHLGRPEGKIVPELSLSPVAEYLSKLLAKEVPLLANLSDKAKDAVVMLENLRFFEGEEKNDLEFTKKLVSLGEVFVNDAFACSHRSHASIVSLPKVLPSAFGFDFLKEVEVLSPVYERPKRPLVLILGGAKKDKMEIAKELSSWADSLLIGGNLGAFDDGSLSKTKTVIARLTSDGKDIDSETIEKFKKVIGKAKTIVWSGPMGIYEEKLSRKGTEEIAKAVSLSKAYTVVGGGDTEAALTRFGLTEKIDFISSGGGAMLEFFARGTLPGIEAIKGKND